MGGETSGALFPERAVALADGQQTEVGLVCSDGNVAEADIFNLAAQVEQSLRIVVVQGILHGYIDIFNGNIAENTAGACYAGDHFVYPGIDVEAEAVHGAVDVADGNVLQNSFISAQQAHCLTCAV